MKNKPQTKAASLPERQSQSMIIERQPDESPDDWARVIEEMSTNTHVVVTRYDDGSVGLRWNLARTMA